jgi:hypothetical protein
MPYTNGPFILLAEDLFTCLSAATPGISQPPAKMSLRGGAAIAMDISQTQNECCDGLGWVRVGDEWPTNAFPAEDGSILPCGSPSWAMELEAGIARCAPVGDIHYTPTEDEHLALARLLEEDQAALREAVCCFAADQRGRGWLMNVGRFNKFGPEGGCVGTVVTITAQVFTGS